LERARTPRKPDDPRRHGGILSTRRNGGGSTGGREEEEETRGAWRVEVSVAVGECGSPRFIVRAREPALKISGAG
jgi:hypothetical protein